ncbi:putative endonuclease [Elusimicrobium posterum]|uniref:GIY-YIG nuclease family protein n=1 Tax=Elusimicrobium posterum TaxID=3116653 RepID=UPI003C709FB2
MSKTYCVYIITNTGDSVLYTGVTSNLPKRIYQHKNKMLEGFSSKNNLDKLVYYECVDNAESAIVREKKIKNLSRNEKLELIKSFNPMFKDLYETLTVI